MTSVLATNRGTGSVMSGIGSIMSGPCSYCSKQSVARCSICRSLYCGSECQANHWPLHRRDCTPPPALIWPEDCSAGLQEVEMTSLSDILQESYFCGQPRQERESKDIENYVSLSTIMTSTPEVEIKIEGDPTSSGITENEVQVSHDLKTEKMDPSKTVKIKENLTESLTENAGSGNSSENVSIEENLVSMNEILTEAQTKKSENPSKTAETEENLVSMNDVLAESKTQKIENPSQTEKVKEKNEVFSQSPTEKMENHSKTLKSQENLLSMNDVLVESQTEASENPSKDAKTDANLVSMKDVVVESNNEEMEYPSKPVKIEENLKLINETLTDSLEAQPLAYPLAIISSSIAQERPMRGVHRVVLPVEHVLSPSHFGICLKEREDSVLNLMVSMAECPIPVQSDWKVSRNQTVAVCWEDAWYRGVATKKCQDKFSVYLVDIGKVVSVARDLMRPLPEQYLNLPPGHVQVCLAGIGPVQGDMWDQDVIQVFISLLNSDLTYPLGVEFLGKVPGDRWAVRLLGLDDRQNVTDLLVELGLAIPRDDLLSCIAFQFQDTSCPEDSSSKNSNGNNSFKIQETLCSGDSSRKDPEVKKNNVPLSSPVNEGSTNSVKNPCKISKSADVAKICQKSTEVSAEISKKGNNEKCKDLVKVTGGGDVCTGGIQVAKSEISSADPTKVEVTNANVKASVTNAVEIKVSVPEVPTGDSANDKEIQLTKTNQADKSVTKLTNGSADKLTELFTDQVNIKSSFSRIPRGILNPECSRFKAVVCHLDSPSSLYLCPESKKDLFFEIMSDIQEVPESGSVVGEVGEACLVMQDEYYYRAEIVQLSADKGSVQVFLLDDGRSLDFKIDSLKPLTRHLKEPGMVLKAELAGLGLAANDWSSEEMENARLLLDVGGETEFDVNVVGNLEGKLNVKLTDTDGVNVAELLVEMGLCVAVPVNHVTTEIALTYGEVTIGSQTVLVCSATSPVHIYISTMALFGLFSDTIFPAVEAAAEEAESVTKVEVGDRVLAHDGEAWYRAEVKQLVSETEASVFLLDIGSHLSAQFTHLKRSKPEVFLHPVVAVPAVIMGWEKEDKDKAEKEWGGKIKELVGEPFSELEVEVMESHTKTGRCVITVPAWKNAFQKKEDKRASMMRKMKGIQK